MKLYLYNTLHREKQEFIPRMHESNPEKKKTDTDHVKMYSCGPTVYGDVHVGNLRAFWFADILKSTIKYYLELPIKHVMNITDVGHLTDDGDQGEDKMQKGAQRDGKTAWEIAQYYGSRFIQFNKDLGNEAPDTYTRATDYIKEQIAIVRMLEQKGLTYEIPGDGIYMDTIQAGDYGKLMPSGHLEGILQGSRVENSSKRHATDFALWKFSPQNTQRHMEWIFEGERSGMVVDEKLKKTLTDTERTSLGFPGWHIECSAMSRASLGPNIDIHTGGVDHINVHHSNEILQSEHSFCTCTPWVKYRLHNQFLNINGEKLSKSLGNAYTLPDILAQGYHPLDLRFMFFHAHYRSFQDFSSNALDQAKKTRAKLRKKLSPHRPAVSFSSWSTLIDSIETQRGKQFIEHIQDSLGDDLNTPKLLAHIHSALKDPDEEICQILFYLDTTLLRCDLFSVEKVKETQNIPEEIHAMARERIQAKKDKNYELADSLREQIQEAGYNIQDTEQGYHLVPHSST